MSTALTTRLLALAALFEGSAGGRINVWDEQYLSLGTLHYAVKMGPGARFLARIYQLDPAGLTSCLGPAFAAALASGQVVSFCRAQVWQQPGRWARPFALLSQLPAYQQADAEAARPYLDGAVKIATRYRLTSERGLAWAFDRCVQQGPSPRSAVDQAFARLPLGLPEYQVLKALTKAYAATANPKYQDVVLRRSLTCALGDSLVSNYTPPGQKGFSLERDFDLSPTRGWKGQV